MKGTVTQKGKGYSESLQKPYDILTEAVLRSLQHHEK